MMIFAETLETGAKAKTRIYTAAMRLYAERGEAAVTVRDLAEAAGMARGTVYNNIEAPEALFGEIANALAREMIWRTEASMSDVRDPVERLATGVRLFVRRAHAERDWGRFMVRFALAHSALRNLMAGPPARDIRSAISAGKFKTDAANTPALVTMLNGATLASMHAVIQGDQTWRQAGSLTAEYFLRAGGVSRSEARRLARLDLPALAETRPRDQSTRKRRASVRERH